MSILLNLHRTNMDHQRKGGAFLQMQVELPMRSLGEHIPDLPKAFESRSAPEIMFGIVMYGLRSIPYLTEGF